MNTTKKLAFSAGWVAAFIVACLVVRAVRNIGTEWMNELGFVRVLVLLVLAISTLLPLVLAVLVWFDQPKSIYKKLQ